MGRVTITRAQRDAFWWLCWLKLATVDDIFAAFAVGDVNEARELRHVYREVTRLLDDIGWKRQQDGDAFAITMEHDALLRAVMTLHEQATTLIRAHAHRFGDGPGELQRAVDGITACDALLIQLARTTSGEEPFLDYQEPEVTATVHRDERRALWHLCSAQLATIREIFYAVDRDDSGEALTLRNRYRDIMRLLDDIGWQKDEPGDQFAITMDPDPLLRVLLRLHETAVDQIADHIDGCDVHPQTLPTAAVGAAACGTLLTQLASTHGTPTEEAPS